MAITALYRWRFCWKRQVLLSLAIVVIAIALCSCRPVETSSTAIGSIRFTDCAGREVVLEKPAERIVLIRGRDLYNISLLLGAEITNRVVSIGCDIRSVDRDIYMQLVEAIPSVADLPCMGSVYKNGVSIEKLLELDPDLVVMDTFMIDRGYNIVDDIERAGLCAVYVDLSHDPLSGPQKSLRVLGKALGEEKRAEEIACFLDEQIKPVLAQVLKLPDDSRPSVYIEAGHVGASAYGPTYGLHVNRKLSSWGQIIEAAGGDNIAKTRVSGMAPIRQETLLAEDPLYILITGAHWVGVSDSMRLGGETDVATAKKRLEGFISRPGWDELRAVRNEQVYGIYHGWCIHATAFAALQHSVKWFYPEVFKDLDPEKALEHFYERFSPVPYKGTYAIKFEH